MSGTRKNWYWNSLEVRYPDNRVGKVDVNAGSLFEAKRWLETNGLVPTKPYWENDACVTDREPPNPFSAGHGISRLHGRRF